MTPDELDAIVARAQAASDVWTAHPLKTHKPDGLHCLKGPNKDGSMPKADAVFHAAARADVLALAEEVRRLTGTLTRADELEQEVQRLKQEAEAARASLTAELEFVRQALQEAKEIASAPQRSRRRRKEEEGAS